MPECFIYKNPSGVSLFRYCELHKNIHMAKTGAEACEETIPIYHSPEEIRKAGWVAVSDLRYCPPDKKRVWVCPDCAKEAGDIKNQGEVMNLSEQVKLRKDNAEMKRKVEELHKALSSYSQKIQELQSENGSAVGLLWAVAKNSENNQISIPDSVMEQIDETKVLQSFYDAANMMTVFVATDAREVQEAEESQKKEEEETGEKFLVEQSPDSEH